MLRMLPLVLLCFGAAPAPSSPTFQEPQGILTLQQAIAAAQLHAPALATYPVDLRIGDARVTQAGLRPNPVLSLEIENIRLGNGDARTAGTQTTGLSSDGVAANYTREREGGSAAWANADMTLSLSQLIELGGKRAAQIEAARKGRDVATWDYEVTRFEVVGDALVRFVELLAAQHRVQQEMELVKLAGELTANVGQRVEAGSVSPLELKRANAEADLAKVKLQDRQRALEEARLQLAASWGSIHPSFTEAAGNLGSTPSLPALQDILDRRANHPALQRWAAELARREALLTVERKGAVPDLTLRVGYRGTASDTPRSQGFNVGTDGLSRSRTVTGSREWEHGLILEASLPVPLFHRNQGAIREAELMVERTGDEQAAWENALDVAIARQHAVATAALERLAALTERVQPELEDVLVRTREGYARGKFDLLRVLDAQRAAIDVRLEVLDARVAYHVAIAEMERLAGASIVTSDDDSPGAISAPQNEKESFHE